MTKPQDYREQRIIAADTQYQVAEGFAKGTYSGSGVLTTGRVVWVQGSEKPLASEETVFAYAEGVGVVAVAAEALK